MECLPIFMTDHARERFQQRSQGIEHSLVDELQTARTLTYKQRIRHVRLRPQSPLMKVVGTVNFVLLLERSDFMDQIPAWKCITVVRKTRALQDGRRVKRPIRDIEPADIPDTPLFPEFFNAYTPMENPHDRNDNIAQFIRTDTWRPGEAAG